MWVDWPALRNARDLGGLPTAAGPTRFGAIVRSDSLARLTGTGLAALRAFGVGTVVDLRTPGEGAAAPGPLAGCCRARPLLDDADLAWTGERFDRDTAGFYVWLLEARARRVAAVLRTIADAPPGAVVVHCGVGKDRTGIVAGLLLALAGVDRDAILADYTLTGDRLRGLRPRRWFRTDPGHLAALLDRVDDRHGGAAGYLRWVGLAEACQSRLRDRLGPARARG